MPTRRIQPPVAQPAKRLRRPLRGAARVIEPMPAEGADADLVVERPDGFYWLGSDGRQAFGPFDSAALARADRDHLDELAPVPGETLAEAESDLGIADWIDPETGEPAEGQAPPKLPPE